MIELRLLFNGNNRKHNERFHASKISDATIDDDKKQRLLALSYYSTSFIEQPIVFIQPLSL